MVATMNTLQKEEEKRAASDAQPKTVKVEMTLPALPKKYEYTGEYRVPKLTEDTYYFYDSQVWTVKGLPSDFPVPIVRKKEWYPEVGDTVWITGFDNNILQYTWCDGVYDKELYEQHRVFRTEFLANQALTEMQQVLHSNFLKNNDNAYEHWPPKMES